MCAKKLYLGMLLLPVIANASPSTHQSLGRPDLAHAKKVLLVCFMDKVDYKLDRVVVPSSIQDALSTEAGRNSIKPFPNSFKSIIVSAVSSSYSKEKTGIAFVGFHDCSVSESPDVVLIFDTNPQSNFQAAILGAPLKNGREYKSTPASSIVFHAGYFVTQKSNLDYERKLLSQFEVTDLETELKNYAIIGLSTSVVHEFGHVAGLEHEFLREDGTDLLRTFDSSPGLALFHSLMQFAKDEKKK